jgi:hypothetical protein
MIELLGLMNLIGLGLTLVVLVILLAIGTRP